MALTPEQWRSVSPHLEKALELPDHEREEWLASLRSENPGLVEHLEVLLREHDQLAEEGFLTQKSFVLPGTPGLTGQKLGPYTLRSPIGQGGMGSVWMAERTDGRFERRVAVKFLSVALMGKGGEERFKQEGSILARLTHPNIAELLDSGITAAGQPYLVLEYIEGQQIDRYCDRQLLSVKARVVLFLDVLMAVAHAHRNLVVHRDIKPSNVLVRNDGQAKLLDFGIAKLLADESSGISNTRLTRDGVVPMTPEYAAPEQLLGEAVTTATDVYVLGVLLYVLLTGQHPVSGDSRSAAELVKAVIDKEPRRPSEVVAQTDANTPITTVNAARRATTPERLSRMLRGDLDVIVGKALKKEPAERYGSVTAFAEDLRRYLASEPIHARPDHFSYRASKFVRRNRTATVLAGLFLVAVVAGLVGTIMQMRSARRQFNVAMLQLRRKQAVSELNEFLLSDAAPGGKPFTVNELLDRAQQVLTRQHANDDTYRVELLVSIGDQYSTQDNDAKARRVLEEAYRLSRTLQISPTRVEASCALAGALARDGDLDRAETLFQEGMRDAAAVPDDDQERIFCLRRGSEVAQERGDAREGMKRIEAAQQVLQSSAYSSGALQLAVRMDLAEAYRMAGRTRDAVTEFEQASRLLTELGREQTQMAVVVYNDWALALHRLGRPLEAERLYLRAIEISRVGNSDDAVSPMVLKNYASVLRDLGRFPEAARYADLAYRKGKEVDNHLVIYQAQYFRALICLDRGQVEQAAQLLADVEPRLKRSLPPTNLWFGALASAQALVAARRGDLAGAVELADHAVEVLQTSIKNGGQGTDFLPIILLRRSSIRLSAGDFNGAEADANSAIASFQQLTNPGAFSCHLGQAHLALARALQAQHRDRDAQEEFQAAAQHLQKTLGAKHPDTRAALQQSPSDTMPGASAPRA